MWFIWLVTKFWNAAVVAAFFFYSIFKGIYLKSTKVFVKFANIFCYPERSRRVKYELLKDFRFPCGYLCGPSTSLRMTNGC